MLQARMYNYFSQIYLVSAYKIWTIINGQWNVHISDEPQKRVHKRLHIFATNDVYNSNTKAKHIISSLNTKD